MKLICMIFLASMVAACLISASGEKQSGGYSQAAGNELNLLDRKDRRL
jgi:hypothetical protein